MNNFCVFLKRGWGLFFLVVFFQIQCGGQVDSLLSEKSSSGGVSGDVKATSVEGGVQTIEGKLSGKPSGLEESNTEKILIDKISGSSSHFNGTWWGYNQSKIVRFENTVYTYVIENNQDITKFSDFTIYRKQADQDWKKGASLPTSKPGNILVDSTGKLHALVFEPTNIELNDSVGKLYHYYFYASASGDITSYEKSLIVDNQATKERPWDETINIRVGAAIGSDDTLALAAGRNYDDLGNTEEFHFKTSEDESWNQMIAGSNLGHEFYYPFVTVTDSGFALLPIQDDYQPDPTKSNIYQKIMFFEYSGDEWLSETIVDLSTHSLAEDRNRLLEQSDLYNDTQGVMHLIYKEFLGEDQGSVSSFKHFKKTIGGSWEVEVLDLTQLWVNWLRIVEVESEIFYIASTHQNLYLLGEGGVKIAEIKIPSDISGIYPYVSRQHSDILSNNNYIDLLLLDGSSQSYPNAANYYLRIPKSYIKSLN